MSYVPVIGLEIHAHLKTRTKMFCDDVNAFASGEPNKNISAISTGHPGTLPTINKQAVEKVLQVGMALAGDVPMVSKFDRKNYFYPDLPKGYQISQYDMPLISNGVLNGIRIKRIHLEEDAGRIVHENGKSLVDYNRAGAPLMELVTEPDITSAEDAMNFARELQLVLRYLNASDADIEKGQMRVEVNISMKKRGSDTLGTKVEIKNIGSISAAGAVIEYEIKRQTKLLESGRGDEIVQETRGWDDAKRITVSQRGKEEAHDYRYFPEPDLPPLDMTTFNLKHLKNEIPELPQAKRARLQKEYGLKDDMIETLVSDPRWADYFERAVSELKADDPKATTKATQLVGNYMSADLRGLMAEKGIDIDSLKVSPENFADLINLIAKNTVSSRAAKDILLKMVETGADPNVILKEEGLEQVSDEGALESIVKEIINAHPEAVIDYKAGKENAVMFLVGKAMAKLKGAGNPQVLKSLFEKNL